MCQLVNQKNVWKHIKKNIEPGRGLPTSVWVENKTVRKRKVFSYTGKSRPLRGAFSSPVWQGKRKGGGRKGFIVEIFVTPVTEKEKKGGNEKWWKKKEKLDPGYLFSGEKEEGGYDKYSEQILAFSPFCMGEGGR